MPLCMCLELPSVSKGIWWTHREETGHIQRKPGGHCQLICTDWCGGHKTSSFSLICMSLVLKIGLSFYWCHRGFFFFRHWIRCVSWRYFYSSIATTFERVDQSPFLLTRDAMSCFCADYFLLCTDGSWFIFFLAGRIDWTLAPLIFPFSLLLG